MLDRHPDLKTFLKMTAALLVVAVASAYILAEVYRYTKEPIKAVPPDILPELNRINIVDKLAPGSWHGISKR